MGRAILAVISAAVAVVGTITIFRLVYVVFSKLIDGDTYEESVDFGDKAIEALLGACILACIAMVLIILYLLGTHLILPVFGL